MCPSLFLALTSAPASSKVLNSLEIIGPATCISAVLPALSCTFTFAPLLIRSQADRPLHLHPSSSRQFRRSSFSAFASAPCRKQKLDHLPVSISNCVLESCCAAALIPHINVNLGNQYRECFEIILLCSFNKRMGRLRQTRLRRLR